MQFTLQNVSNTHQIWSAEASFCQCLQDRHDVAVDRGETATERAEYEPAGFADLIYELMDLQAMSIHEIRDIERQAITDLGPQRFAQVKAVLLRAWQSDRMI